MRVLYVAEFDSSLDWIAHTTLSLFLEKDPKGLLVLGILNKTTISEDGVYRVRTIDMDEAVSLVGKYDPTQIVSCMSMPALARLLTDELGVEIPFSYNEFHMDVGDKALVIWVVPRRYGFQRITAADYVVKIMERVE
jgi:hypothetical protein